MRSFLLAFETVAEHTSACRDVMDRKQKRDAKNARHRRNEERRFDRKIEKMWNPWRDIMIESARYAVEQAAEVE